jgi:hypothetical protein
MNVHTPGPWKVTGQSDGGRYITVAHEYHAGFDSLLRRRTVARIPFSRENDAHPTDNSDARLIAAAPDLLAALKRLAALEPFRDDDDRELIQAREEARAPSMARGPPRVVLVRRRSGA